MYKFVMWGFGVNGKRFFNNCPSGKVVAIIDSNPKLQGTFAGNTPIISFDDYLKNYQEYDVLITTYNPDSICKILEKNGIENILLLNDCPPEIKGFYGGIWIDELPLDIKNDNNVIFGLNLYSILVREYLAECKGCFFDIIPEENDNISRAFAEKYSYIKIRKVQMDETVLWASGYSLEVMGKQIVDVFDFIDKIARYRNPELGKFKGIAEKKRCFLIGNGPSLKMDDLDTLYKHEEDCFGVNGIFKAFDRTCWRPKYYRVDDRMAIVEGIKVVEKCQECTIFYSDMLPEIVKERENEDSLYWLHVHMISLDGKKECKFSDDFTVGTYLGNTVIYGCIQQAIYMGYKEIYLLGVDNNYVGEVSNPANHFITDYYDKDFKANNSILSPEKAYEKARYYAESHDVKIYNATRGGKLEVFERVKFDRLFEM